MFILNFNNSMKTIHDQKEMIWGEYGPKELLQRTPGMTWSTLTPNFTPGSFTSLKICHHHFKISTIFCITNVSLRPHFKRPPPALNLCPLGFDIPTKLI